MFWCSLRQTDRTPRKIYETHSIFKRSMSLSWSLIGLSVATALLCTPTIDLTIPFSSFLRPDLEVKKRRGGKRMRRLKERFEETSLMKQANTRAFSEQAGEYGDDAMGRTVGLLDTATASGSVRKTSEKRKVKFANTRASRKKAAQAARTASANTNGLASSVVFTPVQGMELVNPDAQKDRLRQANEKWFSENAGFQSALPKK